MSSSSTDRLVNFHSLVKLFLAIAFATMLAFAPPAYGQGDADRNVNIVGPTPSGLIGDPGLKQQNEPSCAVRPDNPLHIFCGFNDYRGADLPVVGDAWLGAAMSTNGGLTWQSRLMPGFSGDTPSLGLTFGADSTVIAAPGLVLYNFIAADRASNSNGGIYLHRWLERNKEDGLPWIPGDFQLIASGNSIPGRFIDKPHMHLNTKTGGNTIPVGIDMPDGSREILTMPDAVLSVIFAVFVGNDNNDGTKILYTRSLDYGETWSPTTKLSEQQDINQGANLSSNGSQMVAVWRRFSDNNDGHAIMYSTASNFGKKWTKSKVLFGGAPGVYCPFDQGTTPVSFRTNALPVVVSDGSDFYAFFAARGFATEAADCFAGFSRIVMSKRLNNGQWSSPVPVDDAPGLLGHQVMPSVFSANGTIQLAWYDSRNDNSGLFGPFINDVINQDSVLLRRTMDVYGVQIENGIVGNSAPISRYEQGIPPGGSQPEQVEFNHMNTRIFKQGLVPFDGDYTGVTAPGLRLIDGVWEPNHGPSGDGAAFPFYVSWTDNRDIRGDVSTDLVQPTPYTPTAASAATAAIVPPKGTEPRLARNKAAAEPEPDPSMVYPACDPLLPLDRTRDQNVYFASVRPEVFLSSPTPGKKTITPTGGVIQRAYVVYVQNRTNQDRNYLLTIEDQPDDFDSLTGLASFRQLPIPPLASPVVPLTALNVPVPRRSSAVRTVFVASTQPRPEIRVVVTEQDPAPGEDPSTGLLTLNGNILAPDIENPDYANPDIENFDILNFEVHNPDIENKIITSIGNPDIENPDYQNPDLENVDYANPDYENPDYENFSIGFPDIENPDLENGTLTSGDLANGYTDVSWTMQNQGNTTTGYNLKPFLADPTGTLNTQLFVTRSYATPTSQGCVPVEIAQNQVVLNVVDPDVSASFDNPDIENPSISDASFFIEPGGRAQVTLRVWGTTDLNINQTGVAIYSQSCNTEGGCVEVPDDIDGQIDITPPVFTSVPDDIIGFEATGPGGANVEFVVTAADDVAGEVPVECQPASGDLFPIGTTPVACTANDFVGNEATAGFNVTVVDSTSPVISVPANITGIEATGSDGAVVDYTATATDFGVPIAVSCTPASGSTFSLGPPTTVNCLSDDGFSEPATASFTVMVVDTTPPELTLPDDIVATPGPDGAAIVNFTATAFDIVDGAIAPVCSPASGSSFTGPTTVSCTATDAADNETIGEFQVSLALEFIGLLLPYKPPPKPFKIGPVIQLNWKYGDGDGNVIDGSGAQPRIQIFGPYDCDAGSGGSIVVDDAGSSELRYISNGWRFNWKTDGLTLGCYDIFVMSQATGQTDGPFPIFLK